MFENRPEATIIPPLALVPWKEGVLSAYTGPNAGITQLDMHSEEFPSEGDLVAGVTNWNKPSEYAYGISLSLYEEDRRSKDQTHVIGEPIADVFAVLARENNAIIALGDGASWGKKPRLAARCAVNSAISHVIQSTQRLNSQPNSKTLSKILLEAIDNAQKCILEHRGTLTTLSIGVVCPIHKSKAGNKWGLFIVSVGDSPIYVYSPHTQTVYEATTGCHPKTGERTMSLSGGLLGPAMGTLPDLENLSLAYLPVYDGDIVFATSDGVSDNFYPQILRPEEPGHDTHQSRMETDEQDLTLTTSVKKCCENVLEITTLLKHHQSVLLDHMTAQTVAAALINFTAELTNKKRMFYANCIEQNIHIKRKTKEDPEFAKQVSSLPGKLDHATVVAYSVGSHHYP